ncbi:MAG: hypothetical protein HKO71_02245, partial [Pseudomonadales bacterium]|nr:hypothetical protein [Pseudomonadales bacterium]
MQLTNLPVSGRCKWLLALLASLLVNACGSGSSSAPAWLPNAFSPLSIFANRCDAMNQRFYLRSVFQQHYYWYEDIVDANPASFASIGEHFDYLVTDALSPTGSGKDKDEFSTFVSSTAFSNIISGDGETSYGIRLTSSEPSLV